MLKGPCPMPGAVVTFLDRTHGKTDRATAEFLRNISHEFRTSMNGIMGMAQLAPDTELTAEKRDYLESVKTSADVLLTTINNVLEFSGLATEELLCKRSSSTSMTCWERQRNSSSLQPIARAGVTPRYPACCTTPCAGRPGATGADHRTFDRQRRLPNAARSFCRSIPSHRTRSASYRISRCWTRALASRRRCGKRSLSFFKGR